MLEEEVNEESVKKYSVYVEAQNMIVSLVQEIENAKTKDEVVAIRKMRKDYNNFYHGCDLVGILEYQKERNSISRSLKCVFSKSHMHSEEEKNLNRHKDCSKWLYNFFKANSMSIPAKVYQYY